MSGCKFKDLIDEPDVYDNDDEFIEKSDVEDVIDNIEFDVIEIKDKLEPIKGLSEINEIKCLIEEL